MNANQENERLADNPAVKLLNAMHERYRWRPIAELHEDFGPCVGININDPGYLVIVHANDCEPDEAVTHFTRFAPLSYEVFGEPDEFDTDVLTRRGWLHSDDGEKWWREDAPDEVFTLDEAIRAQEEWMASDA